mgnify:CR=1 FL=1|tara:strand:+ start:6980 stop:8218 length:1239 start_codon:yes stop_codon:yes gene_type:complete
MALTDAERKELEGEIQKISDSFSNFTFQNLNNDYSQYVGANDFELILLHLGSDNSSDVIKSNILKAFSNYVPAGSREFIDSSGNQRYIGPDSRIIQVTDEAGEPVFKDGLPQIETVREGKFFPAANFADSFVQTINTDQNALMAIQDAAIASGYITVEELGNEVNGVGGIITNSLISEALKYIDNEYTEWYPNSPNRNAFVETVEESKLDFKFYPNINSFYGGLEIKEGEPVSTKYITSKEIFANGLLSFLDKKQAEEDIAKRTMDIEAATKIRTDNIFPNMTTLAEDFEDYYQQVNKRPLTDELKEEFINSVAQDWSGYVDALVAQDKFIRAGEVMQTYFKREGTGQGLREEYGGFVTFDRLKPEFNVENPVDEVYDEIDEGAEQQQTLSDEAQQIQDAEYTYMKWLQGSR